MRDAEPNPVRQDTDPRTWYEVAATHERRGERVTVGFTPYRSRGGLVDVMKRRSTELWKLCNLDVVRPHFSVHRTPEWHVSLGDGWTVGFTGRTERQVAESEAELASH